MSFLRGLWGRFRQLPRWGQIAIVVVVVIAAASGGGDNKQTASSSKDVSATTTTVEPATTTTPTQPKSPEAELEDDLDDALDSQNRGIKPQVTVKRTDPATIEVQWAINDNLTDGLRKDGLRIQVVKILKAVHKSNIAYDEVWVRGTFALVDKLGNESEEQVAFAIYSKTTVDAIRFDNFVFKNVFEITAEAPNIHPSFQY